MKLYIKLIYRYYRQFKKKFKTIIFSLKSLFKFYTPPSKLGKGEQIISLMQKLDIDLLDDGFIYFIDVYKTIFKSNRVIDNITLDYEFVLNNSLEDLVSKANSLNNSELKKEFLDAITGINILIDRICLLKDNKYTKYINNFKNKKVASFEEALQRILFYNQILWQTNHNLNGLGRLDYILHNYYVNDKSKGIINKKYAKNLIKDFCIKLNKYYWFKSNGLVGDTGQVIVLGGLTEKNTYFSNEITEIFIDVIKELKKPDPKIILRVSEKMPKDLMIKAIDSIKTGIGSPLLSNDDIIIKSLIGFGYKKQDAYNYCTSACWEPYIPGVSFDQNNIDTLVFAKPFITMLDNEDFANIKDFDCLVNKYIKYLTEYIKEFVNKINKISFERDPIISLVSKSCYELEEDICYGGAYYNHFGLTTVSLSNVINSLLVCKKKCFDDSCMTLSELNEIRKNNYKDEKYIEMFKNEFLKYGNDNTDVLALTNKIINAVTNQLIKHHNSLGGCFKFGLSSPSYITKSNIGATLDGRKNNEAFNVHISNEKVSYTEIINFSSLLNYDGNRFNGNVIDLMVNPSFLNKNIDKFLDMIFIGIKKGIFQMQINVVNSEILIDAKDHPEKHINLVVRVWGFSAYFNDLPLSYKNILIERALANEGKN